MNNTEDVPWGVPPDDPADDVLDQVRNDLAFGSDRDRRLAARRLADALCGKREDLTEHDQHTEHTEDR